MVQDDLEELFRKIETTSAVAERQYEAWRETMGLKTPESRVQPYSPKVATKINEMPVMSDPREVQVYRLRRKYGNCPEDSQLKNAPSGVVKQWREENPAEMQEGQLQMWVRTKLADGKITDVIKQMLLLVARRTTQASWQRFFLYGYTLVQTPSAKQELEKLCSALPKTGQGARIEDYALYAVYSMARYSIYVTSSAQRMKDEGFRNRQEILAEAEKSARQKLDRAQQNLNHARRL